MSPRTRSFSNDEVVEYMRQAPDPFVTASEIADQFDVRNRAALDRLYELRDEGRVKTRDVGARAKVWWLVSDD